MIAQDRTHRGRPGSVAGLQRLRQPPARRSAKWPRIFACRTRKATGMTSNSIAVGGSPCTSTRRTTRRAARREACAFRDNIFAFEDMGAAVLGVSLDDVESHGQFAEKYSLPFSLLPTLTEHRQGLRRAVGFWRLQGGQTRDFPDRPARAASPATIRRVNPATHSDEVLAELRKLMAARQQLGGDPGRERALRPAPAPRRARRCGRDSRPRRPKPPR